jgi:hypothetical protein
MITRNLTRRLERLKVELAPPKDPEMMEIRFSDLVTEEIIHRMFLPAEPPKRGRNRLCSQHASVHALSGSL